MRRFLINLSTINLNIANSREFRLGNT